MIKSIKRVVRLNDAKTSIQMDLNEWNALEDISRRENISRNQLIELIDQHRGTMSLTPSIRLFTIMYLKDASSKIKPSLTKKQSFRNVIKTLNNFRSSGYSPN